jgi:uroporphyrinogen-III synthase
VGDATAQRLGEAGLSVELVPSAFTTEQLAAEFPSGEGEVLTPRADIAPDLLEPMLEAKGWTPTRVDAYRTVFPEALPDEAAAAFRDGTVDAITFTSASTVRGFRRAWPDALPAATHVVCIGPVTADEARSNGLEVAAVADPHTVEGVVEALERTLG